MSYYTIKNLKHETTRLDRVKLTYDGKTYTLKVRSLNGKVDRWEGATQREDNRVMKLEHKDHKKIYKMLNGIFEIQPK